MRAPLRKNRYVNYYTLLEEKKELNTKGYESMLDVRKMLIIKF